MNAYALARVAYLATTFLLICSTCGVASALDIRHDAADTDLGVLPAKLLGELTTSELSTKFLKRPESSAEAREQAERLQEAIQSDDVGTVQNLFIAWSRLYAKHYGSVDEAYGALAAFKTSLHSILHHNQQDGGAIFALTGYSGIVPPPAGSLTTSGIVDSKTTQGRRKASAVASRPPFMSIPRAAHMSHTTKVGGVTNPSTDKTSMDWRPLGKLTSVRDQGQKCNSCWAHAASSAMEAAAHIAYDTTFKVTGLSISRQMLVSCANTNVDGVVYANCDGCNGGDSAAAITFMGTVPILMESAYLETSSTTGNTGDCLLLSPSLTRPPPDGNYLQGDKSPALANQLSEASLQGAVAARPVVVYWNMGSNFGNYHTGVYSLDNQNDPAYGCFNDPNMVNHAMVVVGYNKTSEIWIMQNSMGLAWGESGFVRVSMTHDKNGPCGMYTFVVAPSLKFQHVPPKCSAGKPPSPRPPPKQLPKPPLHAPSPTLTVGAILVSIRTQLANMSGVDSLTDWTITSDPCTPNPWSHVTCGPASSSSSNLVPLGLDMTGIPFNGPIPSQLFKLFALTSLWFNGNGITRGIPADVTNLRNLQDLTIIINHFGGTIPPALSKMTQLTILDLGANSFTGTIPASLSTLTRVTYLGLCCQYLTGTIPASFSALVSLKRLWTGGQNPGYGISGALPASMCLRVPPINSDILCAMAPPPPAAPNVGAILVSIRTQLANMSGVDSFPDWNISTDPCTPKPWSHVTCGVDPSSSSSTKLVPLDLHFSYIPFNGPIPSQLFKLSALTSLSFNNNGISGGIPASVTNLRYLKYLGLTWNPVRGTIPPALPTMTKLTVLDLGESSLSGTIPASLSRLTRVTYLSLCCQRGPILLNGTIPPSLSKMTQLTFLDLAGNALSGTIPASLSTLTRVTYLGLSSQFLNGTIPDSLSKMTRLTFLDLGGNALSGTIPASLSTLTRVTYLGLCCQFLNGTIPDSFSALASLKRLSTGGQNPGYGISGTLPASMCSRLPGLQADIPCK